MRIVSIKASRIDAQKDGTYKVAYRDKEIRSASSLKAEKKKAAKRKPKAA
jgi:hypothetical protein